jgi:hypothetical protein
MTDNQGTQTQDNTQTQTQGNQGQQGTQAAQGTQGQQGTQTQDQAAFSWKAKLAPDYANSPTMKKFPDTVEGFNEAVKSHLTLERLLGNEKVPLPKGKDDVEGWAVFSKALGIPDKPDGYQLEDAKLPDHIKNLSFDKAKFQEFAHKHKLTPEQAKEAWADYTGLTAQIVQNAEKAHKEKMTNVINQMRGEWGDAYQSKVELGQMVLNKFATDKEQNDYLTAVLVSDPQGIKFLATIGEQFSENKIGEFKHARHALTAEEAQKEIDSIRQDPNHPYNNDRATPAERDKAIDYVNSLISVAKKSRG